MLLTTCTTDGCFSTHNVILLLLRGIHSYPLPIRTFVLTIQNTFMMGNNGPHRGAANKLWGRIICMKKNVYKTNIESRKLLFALPML